jgi:cell division transport system permease protein
MKNRKRITRTISELLKLSTLAFLVVFFIFIVNHYYQIKDYANTLSEGLNIFVFFDKNLKDKDNEKILENLNLDSSVFVKEYVNVAEAYNKTVQQNPFLRNISLPNDSKFLQAYAVVKPKSIPDNDFLIKIRNTIERITGVDEIIFDASDFIHYAKIQKQLSLYEKTFFVIISVFFVFLVLKFILIYIAGSDMLKKAKRFFLYLLTTALGFLLFWTVCKYINYSLLISETAVLLIIPFTCVLGIMFDRIDIE